MKSFFKILEGVMPQLGARMAPTSHRSHPPSLRQLDPIFFILYVFRYFCPAKTRIHICRPSVRFYHLERNVLYRPTWHFEHIITKSSSLLFSVKCTWLWAAKWNRVRKAVKLFLGLIFWDDCPLHEARF